MCISIYTGVAPYMYASYDYYNASHMRGQKGVIQQIVYTKTECADGGDGDG